MYWPWADRCNQQGSLAIRRITETGMVADRQCDCGCSRQRTPQNPGVDRALHREVAKRLAVRSVLGEPINRRQRRSPRRERNPRHRLDAVERDGTEQARERREGQGDAGHALTTSANATFVRRAVRAVQPSPKTEKSSNSW